MNIVRTKESLMLFIGDICVLFVSLFLTITLRYGALPSQGLLFWHLAPFSFLFLVSVLTNFIAGLYEKHTLVLKSRVPIILTQVQIVNTIISIAFFYFIPYFGITPKITLFMYLVISLILMVVWRMGVVHVFRGRRKYAALLLAEGAEAEEIYKEINNNQRYGAAFIEWIRPSAHPEGQKVIDLVKSMNISLIVADFSNPRVNEIMPVLYRLIFSGVQFADIQKMYESIFDRVPLSLINDMWLLESVSSSSKVSFDIFKRLMDIIVSGLAGIISLIFYPFVYLAIKLDDRGVLFSYQERIGQNNKIVRIMKFRTMSIANDKGKWEGPVNEQGNKGENKEGNKEIKKNVVTRIGKLLRKSRIDELPQLWNVFRGDISLIGPRPEFPDPVKTYAEQIPFYNIRHIVKPGLSGWAQIYHENHPHHGIDTNETRNKLSYDLYYIKNRSIALDIKIALQTLKVLMSFVGR